MLRHLSSRLLSGSQLSSLSAQCTSSLALLLAANAAHVRSKRLAHCSAAACHAEGAGTDPAKDSHISGQLYGRPDREPTPSPNPGLKQETTDKVMGTQASKPEGSQDSQAYPVQNDPSLPGGSGPDLSHDTAHQLQQEESKVVEGDSGPKAAGQGVVEHIGKKDPQKGSDRATTC